MSDTLTIGVLLFDDVEELDVVGRWEVLGFWASHIASTPLHVLAVGPEAGVVRASKGLGLVADHAATDVPAFNVLVHPGGNGTRALVKDSAHLEWLRHLHTQGTVLASACTGSLVLAAAGLLAGRPATTHRDYLNRLAKIDPSVDVRTRERYVDDGDIVTSAGVSAGIDMALLARAITVSGWSAVEVPPLRRQGLCAGLGPAFLPLTTWGAIEAGHGSGPACGR